ncbi:hypothetical protein QP374_31850, partial [Pseudomonas aeruginosa]
QISEDYMKLLSQGKDITELYQKYSKEELANLGINIYQSNDIERTEERTFDEIISWVPTLMQQDQFKKGTLFN